MPLYATRRNPQSPADFLAAGGRVFAVFDGRTQDSGNVSYGVEMAGARYFVKTAGDVDGDEAYFGHAERVAVLRNAVRVAESCGHRALPPLRRVVESAAGPMLFYDWVDGGLVRNALGRVRGLPVGEVVGLLGEVYDLHVEIAGLGWIANDFYDGSMIYDFERRRLYAVDLDTYHRGPFVNDMGRMFGSKRFMAPEEFELGAIIDERTTVFTMGRTVAALLSDGSLDRKPFRGNDAQYEIMVRACRERPDDRFQSVGELCDAWLGADSVVETPGWKRIPSPNREE